MTKDLLKSLHPVEDSVPVYTAVFWKGLEKIPAMPVRVWLLSLLIAVLWVAFLILVIAW